MREEKEEMDELDAQVERRREVYQHELYVKVSHLPFISNSPSPTPSTWQATRRPISDPTRHRGRSLKTLK